MDINDTNMAACECCGQPRPHPTQPGVWKYRTYGLGSWYRVTVKQQTVDGDEVLTMTHEGETEPDWWPGNAEWVKIE